MTSRHHRPSSSPRALAARTGHGAAFAALLLVAGCDSATEPTAAPEPRFSHRGGPAVLDQEQTAVDPSQNLAIGGPSEQLLAQVVTPGITGRLREIHMPIACSSGDLFVEIQGIDPATGEPDGTVLHSRRIMGRTLPPPLPVVPDFRSLPLGGGLDVTAGVPYAIVLSSDGECASQQGPMGDSYPGGEAFFDSRPNPPGVWVPLGRDLPFQTYVR